jgi:sugar lactone lactonase YvrE
VYVTDAYNHRIRMISLSGNVTTLAGNGSASYADGVGTAASFKVPTGVALDANGIVYVSESNNYRIRMISLSGNVTTLAGSGSYSYADGMGTAASFRYPYGIALDANGIVYVADYGNHRIRMTS